MVQVRALQSPGRAAFFFREEAGTRPMDPGLRMVGDEAIDAELAALATHPLDFTFLLIDRRAARVQIGCGAWGTAPLHLIADDQVLHGHWDVSELYSVLPSRSFDARGVCAILGGEGLPYGPRTIFPGLYLLPERAQACWQPAVRGDVEIRVPPAVPRLLARKTRRDADVSGAFLDVVGQSIARWLAPDGAPVFCELSGGLDSALVACLASGMRRPTFSLGIGLPGNMGRAQARRRSEVIAFASLVDTTVPIRDHLPFSDRTSRYRNRRSAPGHEFYGEAFESLIASAAGRGGDLILTGIGGDELCSLSRAEWDAARSGREPQGNAPAGTLPDFIVPTVADDFRASPGSMDVWPRGYVARSVLEANLSGNPLYLRRGCWPANPLASPVVRRFTEFLPVSWRVDRAIERRALRRLGLSSRVSRPRSRETFAPVMTSCLRRAARRWLIDLFAESRLAAMGIVDGPALARAYLAFCQGVRDDDLAFYSAASLELAARAIEAAAPATARAPA